MAWRGVTAIARREANAVSQCKTADTYNTTLTAISVRKLHQRNWAWDGEARREANAVSQCDDVAVVPVSRIMLWMRGRGHAPSGKSKVKSQKSKVILC